MRSCFRTSASAWFSARRVDGGRTTSSKVRRGSTASTSPRRRRCAAAPLPRPAHGWLSRRRAPEFRRPWSKSRSLARLRAPRLGFGRGPPHHPVPRVLHCRLDLVPGTRLVPPMLVPLPPGPQVGLRVVPGSPHAVARAVEAIAVGGTKAVVVVGAERV